MDLETVIQNEVNQKEKNKYILTYICGIQKTVQMNLFAKQKWRPTKRTKRGNKGNQEGHQVGKEGWDELGNWG